MLGYYGSRLARIWFQIGLLQNQDFVWGNGHCNLALKKSYFATKDFILDGAQRRRHSTGFGRCRGQRSMPLGKGGEIKMQAAPWPISISPSASSGTSRRWHIAGDHGLYHCRLTTQLRQQDPIPRRFGIPAR